LSLSPELIQIIVAISKALRKIGAKWLIGGSCGLQIGQIELNASPRDLDIYVDMDDVAVVFHALQEFATDGPEFSQTAIYSSVLSHFLMEGIQVEVVGGFQIAAKDSIYNVNATYLYDNHALHAELGEIALFVMPFAHELLFNIMRDRPDRYEPIALAMLQKPEIHMPALQDLLARNQWGKDLLDRLEQLLGGKLDK
jgi:hypothetical protein